jgi:membrane-associated protease RseP (regulator of RpoE activity)
MLEGMDWVTLALVAIAVAAYAAVAFWIRGRIRSEEAAGGEAGPGEAVPAGWFSEHFAFYGPILALRTLHVRFFDVFRRIAGPLRAYASVGVVAVAVISALYTVVLFVALQLVLETRPPLTGINAPQNLLLIPGLNEYVPGTIAVWLALVLTLVVHEFGHGILSRVEGIRVRAAGLLVAVIPIGAFVEPDEEELERAPRGSKMRMYGAGISNNLVVGLLAFFLMIAVFGMAVPQGGAIIGGVYKDYPAYNASIEPGTIVLALNGTAVETREDVTRTLAATHPGDVLSLTVEHGGTITTRELTLVERPSGDGTAGFMGIEYYDAQGIEEYVDGSFNPVGILLYTVLPFYPTMSGYDLRVLAFPGGDTDLWQEPFWGFWGVVHFLFWSGFINLNVGVFNALPIYPFDGGYIFREAVDGVLSRVRLERFTARVVSALSALLVVTLVSILVLPYYFNLF